MLFRKIGNNNAVVHVLEYLEIKFAKSSLITLLSNGKVVTVYQPLTKSLVKDHMLLRN